ncbi:MAG: TerB family tellurite resistance protein [Desulfobacterales bacterium]
MSWIGKFLGGTLGFVLGGPLGAIAGAAFGHFYDQTAEELDAEQKTPTRIEGAQMTFFVAVFSMLAKLARVDGRVSAEEMQTMEAFMVRELRLSPQSRQLALRIFQAALASRDSFHDYAQQFYLHFRQYPQLLEFMADILFKLAASDGRMTPPEEALLRAATQLFRLGDEGFDRLYALHFGRNVSHYDVLGVSEKDSIETIKSRYRTLVKEYHPDRIASKGLPDELLEVAEEKFREIQAAYETIKEERGIS